MIHKTAVIAIVVIAASVVFAVEPPDSAYRADFEKWKQHLITGRKQNWLPLVGLFWLKPGANTFGSAADNAIVLPSGPTHVGVLNLQNGDVSVELESGVEAKIGGEVRPSAKLQNDEADNGPTIIELGSLRMHVIRRGERVGLRVRDMNNEAIRNYAGPTFFPIDLNFRVTAKFIPADGKKAVDVPNVLGDLTPTPVVGEVHFKLNGQDLTLTSFEGDAANGLSFVLADPTSKTETYPGGRFLDTDPVKNGEVILDFNHVYNPPCSVTPFATCPLAPKENRLPIAITAGEKYDRAHAHH